MKTPRLSCFIASAFNKKDVDAIYKNIVKKVLREEKVKPLRVDQINHNDDIDDKILALINACDFCIADLTYARPSVYYEAGRVHGLGKPVIFLARSDHFKDKPGDDCGNLRVHFDLQMKNIIPWPSPTPTLHKKLRARVRRILGPIVRRKAAELRSREKEAAFAREAQTSKLERLLELSRQHLTQLSYATWSDPPRFDHFSACGLRRQRSGYWLVVIRAASSFTKNKLKSIRRITSIRTVREYLTEKNIDHGRINGCDVFLISLQAIRRSRVLNVLPAFSGSAIDAVYVGGEQRYPEGEIPVYLHTVTPKSYDDFDAKVSCHLDVLEGKGL